MNQVFCINCKHYDNSSSRSRLLDESFHVMKILKLREVGIDPNNEIPTSLPSHICLAEPSEINKQFIFTTPIETEIINITIPANCKTRNANNECTLYSEHDADNYTNNIVSPHSSSYTDTTPADTKFKFSSITGGYKSFLRRIFGIE